MARRIWLSILTLLVAVCIGLSLLAVIGAALILRFQGAVPVGMYFLHWAAPL